MDFTPEHFQQNGLRKVKLSHLVIKLIQTELLKSPRSTLEIGPSSSGLGGLVLDQFGMTPIDAIESYKGFYDRLIAYNNLLLKNCKKKPVYGEISLGNVENFNPSKEYDLVFGFNAKAKFFDWGKLQKQLPYLLSDSGQVLLTLPEGDYPYVELGDKFEIVVDELTQEFTKGVGTPFVDRNGVMYDQFGLKIATDFNCENEQDKYIVLATKRLL
jgi:hypothetical protein